jgi:hypothetical protein
MYKELEGLKGGHNETWWEVVAVSEPFSSKYWPAVVDGQEKSYFDFDSLDKWAAAKVERRRVTVRLTIAGNPIAAEEAISERTGKQCLATTPNSLDIYVSDDSEEE